MTEFYPYLCGEPECRVTGTFMLTMPEITAHWRSHRYEARS